MSDWTIENEYLYKLPPAILYDFNKVMDCLPNSDWERFASRVCRDQTDLRQVARKERRTDVLIQLWGERKGTVGELLSLLKELQLLRARDVILSWSPVCPPPQMGSNKVYQPFKIPSPPPSKGKLVDDQETRPFCDPGPKPLPRPGPPPSSGLSREKVDCPEAPQSAHLSSKPGENIPPSRHAMCWPFEELQHGTDNFSEALQIGEGGFGHVYRATLRNTEYAVKRLKQDSRLNLRLMKESFQTEVDKLTLYRHPNIVDFAGYCVGGGEHCLLYVFMPNGCLDDRLHSQSSAALSWTERVSVLLGSARAIQFLHLSQPQLIHGDVKSSNILLGEHLEPKLGDFGLARFYQSGRRTPGKTTTVAQTKTVRGTLAYLPDEYLKNGELGVEIDTYSFGVVILEMLTGRRAMETDSKSKTVFLKDLILEGDEEEEESGSTASSLGGLPSSAAKHIWTKHLDPRMGPTAASALQGSLELSCLACRCLDRRKKKRPQMKDVYKVLEDVHSRLKASSLEFSTHESPSTLLNQPPPLPPLPTPLQALDSITHRLSKLGPQEDTYYCPLNSLSSLPPPQTLSSGGSGGEMGSWGRQPPSSQIPCESDDSLGYLRYSSSDPSFPSDPSEDCSRALLPPELPRHCGPRCAEKTDASQSSSRSDMASEKIVMNAAKQRFVQKMAMYEEGRIPMSVLLSSELSSCGDSCNQSREPEESEFESIPGEKFN
ncbi:interleukin-1 receptor-associated kinase 1 isoform X1 [Conger conger]|uniref:interleukin-1 receptor-associated kinase 1 isoform X1 n=2 Tax=Conger conger TaxID=82655 RepID=UPI002A5AE25F|nr:interleukin-1 receptor-associated kinase 1 isoform X1 [Conger conger]